MMHDLPRHEEIVEFARGTYPCPKCQNSGGVVVKRRALGARMWAECGRCGVRGPYASGTSSAIYLWNELALRKEKGK